MTLMIIDCQYEFINSLTDGNKTKLVDNICQLINKAKSKNKWIVLIEYKASFRDKFSINQAKTHINIVKAIGKYKKLKVIKKISDSAYTDTINKLKYHNIHFKELDVCGVNLDCCVRETIRDYILKQNSKINIINNCTRNVYNNKSIKTCVGRWNSSLRTNIKIVDL